MCKQNALSIPYESEIYGVFKPIFRKLFDGILDPRVDTEKKCAYYEVVYILPGTKNVRAVALLGEASQVSDLRLKSVPTAVERGAWWSHLKLPASCLS